MAKVQTSSRGWRIIYSIAAAAPACAAALLPSTAMAAASTLYGLVAGPGGSPALFGSIDLSTGAFTQIGSASLSKGYYAPVYDPTQNVFYMTDTPVNPAAFSGVIDVINAATGNLTQLAVPGQVINGLGVGASSSQAPVPEPGSLLQLVTYLFGLTAAAACRSTRRRGS